MSAEHQLNDGKDNSDPPYQGELRTKAAPNTVNQIVYRTVELDSDAA
jgi:hypothetical protein